MATPPNNYFATNITTIPVTSQPAGAPLVITINPFAEGITTYTINPVTLGSYITYFNIVGPTIGSTFTFYVPSVNGLLGQTITVRNSSASLVNVIPSTNALIDEGVVTGILLSSQFSHTVGDLGAVTLMADPTNADSWYTLNTLIRF
jgi:hypothetical protein